MFPFSGCLVGPRPTTFADADSGDDSDANATPSSFSRSVVQSVLSKSSFLPIPVQSGACLFETWVDQASIEDRCDFKIVKEDFNKLFRVLHLEATILSMLRNSAGSSKEPDKDL